MYTASCNPWQPKLLICVLICLWSSRLVRHYIICGPAVWHVTRSIVAGSVRDVRKFHLYFPNVAVSTIQYLWMTVCWKTVYVLKSNYLQTFTTNLTVCSAYLCVIPVMPSITRVVSAEIFEVITTSSIGHRQ